MELQGGYRIVVAKHYGIIGNLSFRDALRFKYKGFIPSSYKQRYDFHYAGTM